MMNNTLTNSASSFSPELSSDCSPLVSSDNSTPILDISRLRVSFQGFPVVNEISLSLNRKECLCLVGESGCGKSMTSLAIMKLLPQQAELKADYISFNGNNLLEYNNKQMAQIRGNRIAMIFQDPMSSLNPVLTLGEQVAEPLVRHKKYSPAQALEEAARLLNEVGILNAKQRLKDYPHQFSGGMLQRVMIAMMLSCKPDLLIADEPTTALDTQTQKQIVNLLQKLMHEQEMAMLFITHDMHIAKDIADSVAVMYAGKVVEYTPTGLFFDNPLHPYSQGLLNSIPSEKNKGLSRLPTIKGSVPAPKDIILGCRFKNRCPYTQIICDTPPEYSCFGKRKVLCNLHFNKNLPVTE